MIRFLALLLLILVLPMAGRAAQPTRAEIAAEIERLDQHYAARQRELDALDAQGKALAEPGSSLTAYRDLALQVLALRDDLAATQERLGTLLRLLGDMERQLKPFRIVAAHGTFDGPPVDSALTTDEIIALRATVPIPDDPALLPTLLTWSVVKETGEKLKDFVVHEHVKSAGGETDANVRFQLKTLEEGAYVAILHHWSMGDRSLMREDRFPFDVVQALAIERVWVTATAGDEAGSDTLAGNDRAHVYVSYRGPGEVGIALRVRHAQSGALAFAHEWKRGPETGARRTGLRLPEGAFEAGDRLVAEITLTAADGAVKTASTAFAITAAAAGLVLDVPPRIADDQLARFSIRVPDGFAPPYSVGIDAPGLNVALAASGALQGTVHGRASGADSVRQIRVTVTDSKGQRATGRAQVTVGADRPQTAASVGSGSTAPPLSASSPATAPAVPMPPASTGSREGTHSARPAAAAPQTASGAVSGAVSGQSAAPSPARATECRRLHAAYRQAVDHRGSLTARIKAINDGLNQRFLAAHETHKARMAAAGGARRADPALQAEAEEHRKYIALTAALAATKDCGQIVYTLKNSWAARTFGYPAEEATRLCLAHSDAHRAVSQARSAAQGCLTADGKLRPEFAEGAVAAKTPAAGGKPDVGGLPRCVEVTGIAIEAARMVGGRVEAAAITMGERRGSLAPRCKEDGAVGAMREFPNKVDVCGVSLWFETAAPSLAAIRRFAGSNRGYPLVAVTKMSDIRATCSVEDLR